MLFPHLDSYAYKRASWYRVNPTYQLIFPYWDEGKS